MKRLEGRTGARWPGATVLTPCWQSVAVAQLPSDLGWLGPTEMRKLREFRLPKRRSDYLLRRLAAKYAVTRAFAVTRESGDLRRIEVRNLEQGRERGAPMLYVDGRPAGLELSLSDRAGWAVCLLAPPGARCGCDLELVEPRSDAFVRDYLTQSERRFVSQSAVPNVRWLRANLVWSAKECALKIVRTGLRRDTRSVEVHVLDQPVVLGWSPLEIHDTSGARFAGWWRRIGPFVLTTASERAVPPPRPLEDPPALCRCRTPNTSQLP